MLADRRPGFTLPAVLAVTGVVTLIFLVAMTALTSLTSEAASARARINFLQQALTMEARVSYLAATEPFSRQEIEIGRPRSYNGLVAPAADATTRLWLDGRPYRLDPDGNVLLSLQDEAGLINVDALNDPQSERLGRLLGLPDRLNRTLGPISRDYLDSDDLRGINGAERSDYALGGPANRPFLRPQEWLSLNGVREAIDPRRWRAGELALAANPLQSATNVNTATRETLQVIFDLTASQADAVIAARSRVPFVSYEDFMAASGAGVMADTDQNYMYPVPYFRISLSDRRGGWIYRARLSLTPYGLERPIWVDQSELTGAPRGGDDSRSNAQEFPYTPH